MTNVLIAVVPMVIILATPMGNKEISFGNVTTPQITINQEVIQGEELPPTTVLEGEIETISTKAVPELVEEVKSNRWNVTLTKSEIILLAKITFLEAGNQSDKGQQAVVEVILNRIYSDKFPNTLQSVLSQKNQFSTWKNRNIAKATDRVMRTYIKS